MGLSLRTMSVKNGLVIVISVFTLTAGGVSAQSASEVTPSDFAPDLPSLNGSLVLDGPVETSAPAGADSIAISLSNVLIDGGFDQLAVANDAFVARLTRGRIPVSELFKATAELEAEYVNAGFVFARVVLPQQTLRDGGTLRIAVVDGFVERVDTTSLPEAIKEPVDRLTGVLVGENTLTREQIEKPVLLSAGLPGVSMTSTIGAGQRPGGTILVLEADHRPITGFVSFDNSLPDSLGEFSFNSGIEFNSPLSRGEVFYARVSSSFEGFLTDDSLYKAAAAGLIFPIGDDGLALNAEVSSSSTLPKNVAVPTSSEFQRQSIRLTYPHIRSRQRNWTSSFILDRQSDAQDLLTGVAIYEDVISAARFASAYQKRSEQNSFSINGQLSLGLDAFGARSADDAVSSGVPLSRQGADVDFKKFQVGLNYAQPVSDVFKADLLLGAQTSFGDVLPLAEQISIGGTGALSGIESGAARGDNGFFVRADFSPAESVQAFEGVLLDPYVFVAAGEVSIENPTAVESSSVSAQSIGLGVNFTRGGSSAFDGVQGNIEISFGDTSNDSGDTRFGFSLSRRF